MKNIKLQKGVSVIEVLLAVAIFVIFVIGIGGVILNGFQANRLGEEQTIATQYASEGLEVVRSIKNQSFSNLLNSVGTGVATSSGVWIFSGANNQFGPGNKYTRVITVSDTQRDGSGNIVASGGTTDPSTKKITSTVSWNFTPTRSDSVLLTTYVTNWRKTIIGNWANPNTLAGSLDLAGNQAGLKIQVQGNYAYIVRNISGGINFIVIDISNPTSPVQVGSLTTTGTPTNIAVSGNYAYISCNDSTGELKIVNISTPSAPTLAGTYDAPGTAQANGVFAVGTTVYLVKTSSSSNEFYIVNATTPSAPVLVGSLGLSNTANEVTVIGNYAYVATSDTANQLQVINISTPSAPVLAGTLKLGGAATTTVQATGNVAVLGSGATLYTVNISSPATPVQLGTYAVGGAGVNDISLGNNGNYAFLATGNTASELEVIDISAPSTPTLVGIYKAASGVFNGVAYDSNSDRAYAVTNITNSEFEVVAP